MVLQPTQQQAHNRTSSGFQIISNNISNQHQTQTYSPYQSWIKSNKFQIQIPKERRAILSTPTTSTRHQTTLVQDWISNEQVGGKKESQTLPNLQF